MSTDSQTTALLPAPKSETKTFRARPTRRERVRFPLVMKIFLVTAVIIAIVVGLAVGVTIQRADKIATATVNSAIASATSLFKDLERKRLQELKLGAMTISRDPTFFAYVQAASVPAEAPAVEASPDAVAPVEPEQGVDVLSIFDQLQTRKGVLGSDLLIVTDAEGIEIARTDQQPADNRAPADLYEQQPLVKTVVDSGQLDAATGVMNLGSRLYHAAVAPLNVGSGPSPGYLVNAYEIDEKFATQIAKTTETAVYFVPAAGGRAPARSANAPVGVSPDAMAETRSVLSSGKMMPPRTVAMENTRFVLTGEPLGAGAPPQGAAVFLRSLDRELAPFREIERTLLFTGGVALLAAFMVSWLFAKRLTRPIEQLAATAESVTDGNYDIHPDVQRSDEVGVLSRAFAQMVSALRDKAELEELYAEMSARVEERENAAQALDQPRAEEGTILVTDLRGGIATDGDPVTVIGRVEAAMKLQESEIRRQDGIVREIIGHRLVSLFTGDRSILRAVRAARAICEEIAAKSTPDAPLAVGVGIATGEFISGSLTLSDRKGRAIVGNAPLLGMLFSWEAPNNFAYVSLESAQAAEGDLFAGASREEVRLRWLPAPVTVVSLPLTNLATGVVRGLGGTSAMATMRMDESMPVISAPGQDLRPGSKFAGRYLIEAILGRGGMGVVYRALDTQLDEVVAIKTLPGDAMSRSTEELERFKREIRLARKITHRNVLRTFDYGQADGVYFISMEYVRGYTLAECLVENPRMSPRIALGISRQICRGLEAAHEEGIIHRDIKPQNVLVDQKGQVKLMDFGIARMAEAKDAMTAAGLIVGTPQYMSPEQVQGKTLDARSDIYSMGVMLYEMLCGIRPFDSPSLTAVLTAHLTDHPKPPIEIRPDIGVPVNRIIMKCMEKDATKRYGNAAELLAALDEMQTQQAAAA